MEYYKNKKKTALIKRKLNHKLLNSQLNEDSWMEENRQRSGFFSSFIYTDSITNDTMLVSKNLVFNPKPLKG